MTKSCTFPCCGHYSCIFHVIPMDCVVMLHGNLVVPLYVSVVGNVLLSVISLLCIVSAMCC